MKYDHCLADLLHPHDSGEQILSQDLVTRYRQRSVNVHHSFLPAFDGARPYHRAYERTDPVKVWSCRPYNP